MNGTHDSSKTTINRSFAYEIGAETVSGECSSIHSFDDIHSIVQAAVGAGLWATFHNVQALVGRDDHLLSTLLGCILSVRTAIAGKNKRVVVGGLSMVPSSKPIRFSMLFNGQISKIGVIPQSLQTLFRPLSLFAPQRKLLLEKMMLLYEIPSYESLASRLVGVCDHFVAREIINDKQATSCMIRAAKEIGYMHKSEPSSLSKGMGWNIFVEFIKYIPSTTRRYISFSDMKLVVNLFLGTVFMDDEKTLGLLLTNPLSLAFQNVQHHDIEAKMSEFMKTLQSLPGHRAIHMHTKKENASYRIRRRTAILQRRSKDAATSFDYERSDEEEYSSQSRYIYVYMKSFVHLFVSSFLLFLLSVLYVIIFLLSN